MSRVRESERAPGDPGRGDIVPIELVELMDRIKRLPEPIRSELEPIVAEAQEDARFRGRVLAIARDALVRLRLDLELARFDLDASRQDRDPRAGWPWAGAL